MHAMDMPYILLAFVASELSIVYLVFATADAVAMVACMKGPLVKVRLVAIFVFYFYILSAAGFL